MKDGKNDVKWFKVAAKTVLDDIKKKAKVKYNNKIYDFDDFFREYFLEIHDGVMEGYEIFLSSETTT